MFLETKNPNPGVKAPVAPFTHESLIAWLETMPADETYPWRDCSGRCLIGLYSAAHGGPRDYIDQCNLFAQVADCKLDSGPDDGGCRAELVAMGVPYTFGAALQRARSLQSTPLNRGGIMMSRSLRSLEEGGAP